MAPCHSKKEIRKYIRNMEVSQWVYEQNIAFDQVPESGLKPVKA